MNYCEICYEEYNICTNIPLVLYPCKHLYCSKCINIWTKTHMECPKCRSEVTTILKNNELFKKLNNNINNLNIIRNHSNEVIKDTTNISIIIIDNSLSMISFKDNYIFYKFNNKVIKNSKLVTRWEYACNIVKLISEYNLKRGIISYYYLLNSKENDYIENIDYVVIDPSDIKSDIDIKVKFNILENIMHQSNVRKFSPLYKTTHLINKTLKNYKNKNDSISCNIITDGEPIYNYFFELEIRNLFLKYNIFIIVNLCTRKEFVREYYNKFCININKKKLNFDIINNFDIEIDMIEKVGNNFLTYSYDIYICRIAACNNILSYKINKERFMLKEISILCKDILNLTQVPCYSRKKEEFINTVKQNNILVYNYLKKQDTTLLNTDIFYKKNSNICILS